MKDIRTVLFESMHAEKGLDTPLVGMRNSEAHFISFILANISVTNPKLGDDNCVELTKIWEAKYGKLSSDFLKALRSLRSDITSKVNIDDMSIEDAIKKTATDKISKRFAETL